MRKGVPLSFGILSRIFQYSAVAAGRVVAFRADGAARLVKSQANQEKYGMKEKQGQSQSIRRRLVVILFVRLIMDKSRKT
jgi:hypothetical protein